MEGVIYTHIHSNIVMLICTIVDARARIDTSGGVFVYKDVALKSM
mgnify:CR=1 FL=1